MICTQDKYLSGRSEGLLPRRPLRTVRASFPAHGSIKLRMTDIRLLLSRVVSKNTYSHDFEGTNTYKVSVFLEVFLHLPFFFLFIERNTNAQLLERGRVSLTPLGDLSMTFAMKENLVVFGVFSS